MTQPPPLIISTPGAREAERRYVLDLVLGEWLGIEYEFQPADRSDVEIRLRGDDAALSLTMPDVLLSSDGSAWLRPVSLPRSPIAFASTGEFGNAPDNPRRYSTGTPSLDSVPVLYGDVAHDGRAVRRTESGLALSIDVFGCIFFMVTRYEEAAKGGRDVHGRFRASDTVMGQLGLSSRPVVDEWTDLLWSALRFVWPRLRRRETEFRLRLVHDVDQPWATWRRSAARVLRSAAWDVAVRRRPALALERTRAMLRRHRARVEGDPYDTFDVLMDISERHGLQSGFFFLSGIDERDPEFSYRLSDEPVQQLLRRVGDRGHEVGLHTSYASHDHPERAVLEFDALRRAANRAGIRQDVWGVRQHYLRFSVPGTWRALDAAGLDYDSTLGFAEELGFRAGTCQEFRVFDLLSRLELGIREIPIVAMDVTLFEYLGVSRDDALQRIADVVASCKRHRGQAVVLVHNNSLRIFGLESWYPELIATIA